MVDVFIRTNTPIGDLKKALAGFECNCVMVRDAGAPTEFWRRAGSQAEWALDEAPGFSLFEDLTPDCILLEALLSEGAVSRQLEGDRMSMFLDRESAQEWLDAMKCHRYAFEDAIGCSVGVTYEERDHHCAAAIFPLSTFKGFMQPVTPVMQKVLAWCDAALVAGADEISAAISVARMA